MTLFLLSLVALVVGCFLGAVGVGGVLMVPGLALVAGLGIHSAAGTALFAGMLTCVSGVWLFARTGHMPWRLALWVSAGAVVGAFPGARLAASLGAESLTVIIAAIVVVAGLMSLRPVRERAYTLEQRGGALELAALVLIGAAAGFAAGLSGAGGPVFVVPILMLLGYSALAVVASTNIIALAGTATATISNAQFGFVDYRLALWSAAFMFVGQVIGVRLAHRASPLLLRRLAAGMCIAVGAALVLVKS